MDKYIVKDCSVAEQHPSTQGHFPGQPVVPGAYLLAELERLLAEDLPHRRIVSLRKVKFLKPLVPGCPAQLHYRLVNESKVQFSISSGADTVLDGSASLAVV